MKTGLFILICLADILGAAGAQANIINVKIFGIPARVAAYEKQIDLLQSKASILGDDNNRWRSSEFYWFYDKGSQHAQELRALLNSSMGGGMRNSGDERFFNSRSRKLEQELVEDYFEFLIYWEQRRNPAYKDFARYDYPKGRYLFSEQKYFIKSVLELRQAYGISATLQSTIDRFLLEYGDDDCKKVLSVNLR